MRGGGEGKKTLRVQESKHLLICCTLGSVHPAILPHFQRAFFFEQRLLTQMVSLYVQPMVHRIPASQSTCECSTMYHKPCHHATMSGVVQSDILSEFLQVKLLIHDGHGIRDLFSPTQTLE